MKKSDSNQPPLATTSIIKQAPSLQLIFWIIATSVLLGILILNLNKNGAKHIELDIATDRTSEEADHKQQRGMKGGNLFIKNEFGVEVTIFEQGVAPQFRIYLYQNGKPLPPTAADIEILLSRLGRPVQLFNFTIEDDYLLGDQEVGEPHSFDLSIVARRQGETYSWHHSQAEMRIEMSDEKAVRAGIEIKTSAPAVIKPTIQFLGQTAFNHHDMVRVVPRVPGIVNYVTRHKGKFAKKGEVLAIIESQVLAELRSQLLATQKRLTIATLTYQREKNLWQNKITAEQDYLAARQLLDEAEIALNLAAARLLVIGEQPESVWQKKNNLNQYEIRAPISGLIITETLAQGAVVRADTEIFTLVDISTMYGKIMIYPKDLDVIKLGQSVTVKAVSQDISGQGVITFISDFIDEQTRTVEARVILDNTARQWRSGMFINILLSAAEIPVPVAVSVDALHTLGNMTVVFGRYGDYFEARPVTLGHRDEKMVEVLSGLLAGEQYATKNSFIIKADIGKAGATHVH